LLGNGLIVLNLLLLVSPRATMGNYFTWESGDRTAAVGSIDAEKMLQDALGELSEALKQGIDVFVEHLPCVDLAELFGDLADEPVKR
jgi:hypothetical protein